MLRSQERRHTPNAGPGRGPGDVHGDFEFICVQIPLGRGFLWDFWSLRRASELLVLLGILRPKVWVSISQTRTWNSRDFLHGCAQDCCDVQESRSLRHGGAAVSCLGERSKFSTHAATLDAIAMTHTLSHAIMCPTQPGRPVRRFKCWVTVTALSKYVGCDWAGKSRP